MAILIPHFSLPFRFKTSAGVKVVAVVEQDSYDEIFDAVEVIVRYPRGSQAGFEDFGVTDQTFASPRYDHDLLRAEIEEWEPRAEAVIEEEPLRFADLIERVRVDVYRREGEV